VTANNGSNNISVLSGHGDGTFQAAVNDAAGTAPNSLTVGDFSGSGQPELVTTNPLNDTVTLLLPSYAVSGDHTYSQQSNPSSPGKNPYGISVTINHDSAPATSVSSSALVGDLPVLATGASSTFQAVPGQTSASQVVATFTDPGGAEPTS